MSELSRPGARAPLVDQRGMITPVWWRYLGEQVFQRIGGALSGSLTDISQDIPEDQPAEKFNFDLERIDRDIGSLPYAYTPAAEPDDRGPMVLQQTIEIPVAVWDDVMARILRLERRIIDIESNPNL